MTLRKIEIFKKIHEILKPVTITELEVPFVSQGNSHGARSGGVRMGRIARKWSSSVNLGKRAVSSPEVGVRMQG